ncbi:hypothetical protein MRX96_014762 [Rhipicephalus microplus]
MIFKAAELWSFALTLSLSSAYAQAWNFAEAVSRWRPIMQCLTSGSSGDVDTLVGRLACPLAQLVQFSAQQFAATFPFPLLATAMQMSTNRLSNDLAVLARCF